MLLATIAYVYGITVSDLLDSYQEQGLATYDKIKSIQEKGNIYCSILIKFLVTPLRSPSFALNIMETKLTSYF